MTPESVPSEAGSQHLQPFSERLRKALAHDLRSSLGTIVNYAAILESHESPKREDVRAFAARIRLSANRLAVMLQSLSEATALSMGTIRIVPIDLSVLLRSVLSDLGLHGHYPAKGTEPEGPVTFDRELLTFAWRSFLSIHEAPRGTEAGLDLDLDLDVDSGQQHSTIELFSGPRPPAATTRLDFAQFAESHPDRGSSEACFALGLAEDLIQQRGGRLELSGRPGEAASLRLILPVGA